MSEPPLSNTSGLSVADLAQRWNVSATSIRRLIKRGLPTFRVGFLLRINLFQAEKWVSLESQKLNDHLNLRDRYAFAIGQSKRWVNNEPMQLIAPTTKIGLHPRDLCFYGSILDPVTNKVRTKYIPKAIPDETAARAWLVDHEKALHAQHVAKAAVVLPSIRNLFDKWADYLATERLNKRGKPLDERTRAKWLGCIKHHALTASIADVPLTNEKFTARIAAEWVRSLTKRLTSTYYVRDCGLAMRQMIGDARRQNWIDLYANPFADEIVSYEVPQAAPMSGANNPIHLSKEEAIKVLTCKANIPFGRRVMTLLAVCQGARIRELQGLAWKHVDLKAGTLEIERQIIKGGNNPTFKAPKADSYRVLPLHPLVVQALTMWKKHFPTISPETPLFPKNGSWDAWEIWNKPAAQFRSDLISAGLSDKYEGKHLFDFHSLRRTFMTLLNDAGALPESVAALAGHAQKGVRRHYIKENMPKYRPVILMLPFAKLKLHWLQPAAEQNDVSEAAE